MVKNKTTDNKISANKITNCKRLTLRQFGLFLEATVVAVRSRLDHRKHFDRLFDFIFIDILFGDWVRDEFRLDAGRRATFAALKD